MIDTDISINILAQFLTPDEKLACRQYIKNVLRPNTVLVMDDFNMARDIVQDTGGATTVIYRAWDINDHRWHEFQSAEQIYERHRPFMQPNIYSQIWNEPSGYANLRPIGEITAKLCEWADGDVPRLVNSGIVLPGWAVGHPDEKRMESGEYDAGLVAIHKYQRVALLHSHEYAIRSTVDEQPYRIGRIENSLKRAAFIGKPIHGERVVIGEYGRDFGGGVEDGWQMVFTPDEYLLFLLGGMPTYRRLGVRCVMIFCVGKGANGMWRYFNVWGYATILNGIAQYNREHEDMPQIDEMVLAEVTAAYVDSNPQNSGSAIRSQPGTSAGIAIVGRLHKGDRIRISKIYVQANGLNWHKVEKLGANNEVVVSGWAADTTALSWQEIIVPPEVPTHPPDNPPDEDSDHDTYPNLPPTPELHPDSMSEETRDIVFHICDWQARLWAALAEQVKPR